MKYIYIPLINSNSASKWLILKLFSVGQSQDLTLLESKSPKIIKEFLRLWVTAWDCDSVCASSICQLRDYRLATIILG